jgi:hypothetical protein
MMFLNLFHCFHIFEFFYSDLTQRRIKLREIFLMSEPFHQLFFLSHFQKNVTIADFAKKILNVTNQTAR